MGKKVRFKKKKRQAGLGGAFRALLSISPRPPIPGGAFVPGELPGFAPGGSFAPAKYLGPGRPG